jgi:hypothetical protein
LIDGRKATDVLKACATALLCAAPPTLVFLQNEVSTPEIKLNLWTGLDYAQSERIFWTRTADTINLYMLRETIAVN